jgi:hypothetical protein
MGGISSERDSHGPYPHPGMTARLSFTTKAPEEISVVSAVEACPLSHFCTSDTESERRR